MTALLLLFILLCIILLVGLIIMTNQANKILDMYGEELVKQAKIEIYLLKLLRNSCALKEKRNEKIL